MHVDELVRDMMIGGIAAPAAVTAGDVPIAVGSLKQAIARQVRAAGIPRDAAARHLGVTPRSLSRWMHGEDDAVTNPRNRQLQGEIIGLLRRRSPEPVSRRDIVCHLIDREIDASPEEVHGILDLYLKLGQIEPAGKYRYRATERRRVTNTPERTESRAQAIYRRVQALPRMVRSYIRGESGARAPICRMNIPPDRVEVVAQKVTDAIMTIYNEEMAREVPEDSPLEPMTLFFLSARGWHGEPE
jgi:hypothetical protein